MENFNIKSLGIGLVVTVVCVALMGSAFRSKGIAPGDVAPAFSESGTDGKTPLSRASQQRPLWSFTSSK